MSFLLSVDSCGSLDKLDVADKDEELANMEERCTDGAVLAIMSHTPLYQGYLFKESSFHKAFNKRYFVLYQDLLVYYKEEDQFLKRSTPEARLKHSSGIIYLDGCYLTKPETLPYGARFCFILHAPHKNNKRTEIKLVSKTKHDKHMWISMLQAQNPKLVCQPSTTTHSFRQAIEKSNSFASIDSFTCGAVDGITFKVESCHFHSTLVYRSISECKQQLQIPSLQYSTSSDSS